MLLVECLSEMNDMIRLLLQWVIQVYDPVADEVHWLTYAGCGALALLNGATTTLPS
jgi:hypothetical protein